MFNENNLSFIKERITEIRSALLFSMSNELIKTPTTIVNILRMDDNGQLWFFIPRPLQFLHDSDKKFPARLQFYRKGKPFFLNVSGSAGMDENNDLINELSDDMEKEASGIAMQNMMLVKLKITRVEYHEHKKPIPANNSLQNAFQNLYDALFKPSYHYRPLEIIAELA